MDVMDETITDSLMTDDSELEVVCRGYMDDDGVVILPCTDKFLHILVIEMRRAWAEETIADIDSIDEDEILRRLRHLSAEIPRLLDNPDLFPSNEARVRFLAAIALDSELQFQSACTTLLIQAEVEAIMDDTDQEYAHPTYTEDCNGWENFLLNMAPGAPNDPTDRARTTPQTSFQIVPPVGMRIISDMEREERDIERFVVERREAGMEVSAATTTLMVDFDKDFDLANAMPTFSLPQQTYNATCRPNPFRSTSGSILELRTTNLPIEQIGTFLHKLDHPPAPPNHPMPALHALDVFPQIAIRSWYPPTRVWDLKYD